MKNSAPIEPIDYLVIGHVTQDLTANGPILGGTASYSSLTARAIGLRVGVVTACRSDLEMPELDGIAISAYEADVNTTFENIHTPTGRIQYIHNHAPVLDISMVPETWRRAPIVHFGPVDQEIDSSLVRGFSNSFVGMTLQGMLRSWDGNKRVHYGEWPESNFFLSNVSAACLSIEDIEGNESRIEEMVASVRVLAVTEGPAGARIYWNGDMRHFTPPKMNVVDEVGAGDIFATAFFIRLYSTRDPWEAARFATQIASRSVTRQGLGSVPTKDEVMSSLMEVVPKN
jgi:sugar/nucleoside kinase (ribokinase family)